MEVVARLKDRRKDTEDQLRELSSHNAGIFGTSLPNQFLSMLVKLESDAEALSESEQAQIHRALALMTERSALRS